jgi:hypothetical protein
MFFFIDYFDYWWVLPWDRNPALMCALTWPG